MIVVFYKLHCLTLSLWTVQVLPASSSSDVWWPLFASAAKLEYIPGFAPSFLGKLLNPDVAARVPARPASCRPYWF